MKEHPILFSGPMVRAILDGRKMMTRRVVKVQDPRDTFVRQGSGHHAAFDNPTWWTFDPRWDTTVDGKGDRRPKYAMHCPYGIPGDQLWVRETLRDSGTGWRYAADSMAITMSKTCHDYPAMIAWAHHQERDYCPSIHMPRWASRITLAVTSVRVERVQDITEADALAEGCDGDCGIGYLPAHQAGPCVYHFAQLWDTINGTRAPWASNPWVWVVGFEVSP